MKQDPRSTASPLPEFAQEHVTGEAEQRELAAAFATLGSLLERESGQAATRRARLLATISEAEERFAPLFGKLTQLFDLNAEALRAVFTRAADERQWQPGPLPWVSLFHLVGGPGVSGLDVGLVRLKRGMPFPAHRHTGSERVLILEGGYHDDQGRWYGPGEVHDMTRGTEHSLQLSTERDTLLAVVLEGEIQVLGT